MHARFGMPYVVFAQGFKRKVKNCEVAKKYFSPNIQEI